MEQMGLLKNHSNVIEYIKFWFWSSIAELPDFWAMAKIHTLCFVLFFLVVCFFVIFLWGKKEVFSNGYKNTKKKKMETPEYFLEAHLHIKSLPVPCKWLGFRWSQCLYCWHHTTRQDVPWWRCSMPSVKPIQPHKWQRVSAKTERRTRASQLEYSGSMCFPCHPTPKGPEYTQILATYVNRDTTFSPKMFICYLMFHCFHNQSPDTMLKRERICWVGL